MRLKKFQPSLETQIIILAIFIVISVLVFSGFSFYNILYQSVEESVQKKALEITRLFAKMPSVKNTLENGTKNAELQKIYEEYLEESTDKVFLVLIDQNGIRYTHPNRDLIGYHITGNDEIRALHGETYVSKAHGISGYTLRTYVPVYNENQEQIGVISIGMLRENLIGYVKNYIDSILFWLFIALLIGMFASILLAKRIKRALYGYEPDEIARLFSEKEAMLESLHEGIIAIDNENRITLVNRAAKQILGLPQNLIGKKLNDTISEFNLLEITTASPGEGIEKFVNHVTILIRYHPIFRKNEKLGTIMTFRDITEVRSIAEELTGVQQYIDGLRAKSHEFMNKLQTISGLVEMQKYEEVKEYIITTTSKQQDLLHFLNRNIKEPKISGLLLGKIQQAEELNIKITFTPGSKFQNAPHKSIVDSLVLIIGNLLQNAIDVLKDHKNGEILITILDKDEQLVIVVEDNGKGISEREQKLIFQKGFSTKGSSKGYGLYLVKYHLENLLDGKLYLHSTTNEGSSFVVEIPKNNRTFL